MVEVFNRNGQTYAQLTPDEGLAIREYRDNFGFSGIPILAVMWVTGQIDMQDYAIFEKGEKPLPVRVFSNLHAFFGYPRELNFLDLSARLK